MTKSCRLRLGCLALSAALLAGLVQAQAQAQAVPTFEDQIQQGQAQLAAGNAESALNSGDAAIRIDPERWDGYALAGEALLALKHYEAAADALSKAIERAPAAQQASLREQRRQSLIAEVGNGAGGGEPASTPPPVPAASAVAPVPAPAVAAAPPVPAPPIPASPVAAPAAPPAAAAPAAAPAAQASAASAPAPVREVRRKGRLVAVLDPADAAWTDASTGLMWSKPSYYPPTATGPWNYRDAKTFCTNLNLLGHDDWRLPTVDELQQVYLVSSHAWHWSEPKFSPDSGMNEALKSGLWRVQNFSVNGGDFSANRLLMWSSSPGDEDGQHVGVYFGRRYNVQDETRVGDTFPGESRRHPFHGYAICVRSTR